MQITLDTSKVDKRLKTLVKGIDDFREPLEKSGQEAIKMFEGNFPKKGAEFGKWKALTPATLRAKARLGFPSDILVRTGKLKSSFRAMYLKKKETAIGNDTDYYPYHQVGGAVIPQRKMIGINKALIRKVNKEFVGYIKGLLTK